MTCSNEQRPIREPYGVAYRVWNHAKREAISISDVFKRGEGFTLQSRFCSTLPIQVLRQSMSYVVDTTIRRGVRIRQPE